MKFAFAGDYQRLHLVLVRVQQSVLHTERTLPGSESFQVSLA
jgi:hypothetical protein